jgi:hypothetical protein
MAKEKLGWVPPQWNESASICDPRSARDRWVAGGGEQEKASASAKDAVFGCERWWRSGFLHCAAHKSVSGFGRNDGSLFGSRMGSGNGSDNSTSGLCGWWTVCIPPIAKGAMDGAPGRIRSGEESRQRPGRHGGGIETDCSTALLTSSLGRNDGFWEWWRRNYC